MAFYLILLLNFVLHHVLFNPFFFPSPFGYIRCLNLGHVHGLTFIHKLRTLAMIDASYVVPTITITRTRTHARAFFWSQQCIRFMIVLELLRQRDRLGLATVIDACEQKPLRTVIDGFDSWLVDAYRVSKEELGPDSLVPVMGCPPRARASCGRVWVP